MRDKILMGLLLLATGPSAVQAQWAVEAFLGTAQSARSTLTIRQAGEPDIRFTAQYATRPLNNAPYYGLRVSRWWPSGWGVFVDDLHHKLYLTNNPPEVQEFEVTYGYNLLSLGPARRSGEWSVTAGAGPVVTNPTSMIRGQALPHGGGFLDLGYHLDGVHVQAGVNRRFYVGPWLFVSADVRVSAAWAQVDVSEGTADVPNYALHFLVGMGAGNKRGTGTGGRGTGDGDRSP